MNAPILLVLADNPRLPRRTTTGLEGLQYAATHRRGALVLQGNAPGPEACSPAEAWETLIDRLQPMIREWGDLDRAILVMRMQGYTVREIKAELQVSGDRVCAIIAITRSYIDGSGLSDLGDLQQIDDPQGR